MDKKESQVDAGLDWANKQMEKLYPGIHKFQLEADMVTMRRVDEFLKQYNEANKDRLLKQLPKFLYYGITQISISDRMRWGIGQFCASISKEITTYSVILHANKFNALDIAPDSLDKDCDFYGVIVIATKYLNLSKLTYSFDGANYTYSYAGIINPVNFDKVVFF